MPEHLVAEIIDGDLVTSPRPALAQARAASSLRGELYGPFDRGTNGPGGWVILGEPESPSTVARDRADKVPIYLRERVAFVWLVDPGNQTLEAFKLDGGAYRLLGAWRENAVVKVEPFESFALDLSALWAR